MKEPQQLGFGFDDMAEEQRTAHIPSTMEDAIPYYRGLIEKHHAAMMSGDVEKTMAIRREADDLAYKVNGDDAGIKGGPDAPCYVLERATAAPEGTMPVWGQTGEFTLDIDGMKVRIEQDGIFGTGSHSMFWPGFAAHAVDYDKPFLSETGFRSFIGVHTDVVPGISPDKFAEQIIRSHVTRDRKNKLGKIGATYVEREMARRSEKPKQEDLTP
jgi:hypothetical protein